MKILLNFLFSFFAGGGGPQRTICGRQLSPSTFTWVPGIELSLTGVLLGHLTGPALYLLSGLNVYRLFLFPEQYSYLHNVYIVFGI